VPQTGRTLSRMRLPFQRSKPLAKHAPTRGASEADVERVRAQARRRLLGAVVLLGVGVVGFPWLFETTPRPLPVDTPIEVSGPAVTAPRRIEPVTESAGGMKTDQAEAAPTASPAAETVSKSRPAPTPEPGPAAAKPAQSAAPARVATAEPKTEPKPEPAPKSPETKPAPKQVALSTPRADARDNDGARARALLEGKAASAAPAARFVVQVGAYADADTLHQARSKVEQLGLKTYIQVIDSSAGRRTRVRIGPFATRAEAEAAASRVKQSGLPANILTL
jgi:DedD protein